MIARIWKGRTLIAHQEEYTAFMKSKVLPDYSQTEGFVKLSFLQRTDEQFAYFELITYWENMAVIKHFAGEDFEQAKYYPEDQKYLLEFPEKVTHYTVFADK